MRKYVFALFIFLSLSMMAQESHRVYCELLGYQKLLSSKVIVRVDFGQETSFWLGYSKQYLVDEDGRPISFNSMVDAMNYMGELGWKFEQAYVVTTSSQNVYHWLLSKDISSNAKISSGFMTKKQFEEQGESSGKGLLGDIDDVECSVLEESTNGFRICTSKRLSVEQIRKVKSQFSINKDVLQFYTPDKIEKSQAYAGITGNYIIIYETNEFIPLKSEAKSQ